MLSSPLVTRRCRSLIVAAVAIGSLLEANLRAQELVPLISETEASAGWRFNNGQEFPGATGTLTVDTEAKRDGRDSLKLVGDFTKGGLMWIWAG